MFLRHSVRILHRKALGQQAENHVGWLIPRIQQVVLVGTKKANCVAHLFVLQASSLSSALKKTVFMIQRSSVTIVPHQGSIWSIYRCPVTLRGIFDFVLVPEKTTNHFWDKRAIMSWTLVMNEIRFFYYAYKSLRNFKGKDFDDIFIRWVTMNTIVHGQC